MAVIEQMDGILFEKLIVNGAKNLKLNINKINDLNVFPVPDGDTGSNMYMTLKGGIDFIEEESSNSINNKVRALADGMMLNARGNSGVILSQIFNGFALGLKDFTEIDVTKLNVAFFSAVKQAYSSVTKPVEGTILTVIREAYEESLKENLCVNDISSYMNCFAMKMEKSLNNTPNLLEVLKEANVVDSGGAGLLCIIEGMRDFLNGKEITDVEIVSESNNSNKIDFSKFNENSIMKYGYCTELLLQLQKIKIDIDTFDVSLITNYLSTFGDSIAVFRTGSIVKIHIHTMTPSKVLEYCQQFGEFLTIKIENMTLQHNDKIVEMKPKKKYGIVAVGSGAGLIETFKEMGVDVVIDGGQTNNPSTKSFIDAFEEVCAENIFVFPNNSNIIMTANEAKELYLSSNQNINIFIINTKNIGEGYSALCVFDRDLDSPVELEKILIETIGNVVTGQISKSIRNAVINHVSINKDDYIGFSSKTMISSNQCRTETYYDLVESLGIKNKSFVINITGKDVNIKEQLQIEKYLKEKYPFIEIFNIDGGQEIYDYVIILQ